MNFTLKLGIGEKDLRVLAACGMRITLAKPVEGGGLSTVWLVFDPFMSNTVEWAEEYGLYASAAEVRQGAVVHKMSEDPQAADGRSYHFGKDRALVFDPGDEPCGKGSFKVRNLMDKSIYPYLAFGLIQKAQVNGQSIEPSIINAGPAPFLFDVVFTPLSKVYVWLQDVYRPGTVLADIADTAAEVDFGGGRAENSLIYDSGRGCFVPVPEGR
jgi:hypothetical protein